MHHKKTKSPPTKPLKADGLTPKQRIFKDVYIATGNGTEAARQAYPNQTNGSQRVQAFQNLTKPNVINAIIADLKEKDLTRAFVLENLAKETRDDNAFIRVKALELIGKHLKLFTDKVDHTHALEHVKSIGWASDVGHEDSEGGT